MFKILKIIIYCSSSTLTTFRFPKKTTLLIEYLKKIKTESVQQMHIYFSDIKTFHTKIRIQLLLNRRTFSVQICTKKLQQFGRKIEEKELKEISETS